MDSGAPPNLPPGADAGADSDAAPIEEDDAAVVPEEGPPPGFFAAPDGSPSGTGAVDDPWDLQTALTQPSDVVAPGDTIWLRGGTYVGRYHSDLVGTVDAPITVRSYPGEWATVDGNRVLSLGGALAVRGAYEADSVTLIGGEDLTDGQTVRIGDEHVELNGKVAPDSNVFASSSRGWDGTVPAAHAEGTPVELALQIVTVEGAHTILRGFEVTNSSTERVSINEDRGTGINSNAPGTRLINMVVHDVGHPGIGMWDGVGDGGETYGCIVYYNGTYDHDGGWTRGSGIYTHNTTGHRTIEDNIWFRNFTGGISVYTTNSFVNGYRVEGNISFEHEGQQDIWAGSETEAITDLQVVSNYTYVRPGNNAWDTRFGYTAAFNNDVLVEDNYLVSENVTLNPNVFLDLVIRNNTIVARSGGRTIHLGLAAGATNVIDGNTYYNPNFSSDLEGATTTYDVAAWQAAGFDPNGTFIDEMPTENVVFVRPNRYEPGRGHVAVYNWAGDASVEVDVSEVLEPGDEFEVRDVLDYFGTPVVTGAYAGGTLAIPMDLTTVAPFVGTVTHLPSVHTAPTFGAFVVQRL